MHELSIICSAMETVNAQCEENHIKRVTKIKLVMGDFVAVDSSALDFAFKYITRGTICEGAELQVENITPMAYCDNCSKEFQVSFMIKTCPICGEFSNEITKGYEMLLYSIEGE